MSAHRNNFIVVLKVNGKTLREVSGNIYIPFESEYSIEMRNLDASRKCQVEVEIDGENIADGKGFLIYPNGCLNLERFVDDLNYGQRFKFIQKTKEIAEARGDKVIDGTIRVMVQFEKVREFRPSYPIYPPQYPTSWKHYKYESNCNIRPRSMFSNPDCIRGSSDSEHVYSSCVSSSNKVAKSNLSTSQLGFSEINPSKDEGITAHGSMSHQNFSVGYIGELEDGIHTIVFHLKGCNDNEVIVKKPITTKMKIECPVCFKRMKSSFSYCSQCGAKLY